MLKKEFPNENVMQIPAKYSNLKENYLDYLEQRVKQYQQWEKRGSIAGSQGKRATGVSSLN